MCLGTFGFDGLRGPIPGSLPVAGWTFREAGALKITRLPLLAGLILSILSFVQGTPKSSEWIEVYDVLLAVADRIPVCQSFTNCLLEFIKFSPFTGFFCQHFREESKKLGDRLLLSV